MKSTARDSLAGSPLSLRACLALLAAPVAACGQTNSSDAAAGGSGGTEGDAFFVQALVDGEPLVATEDVRAHWWPGLAEGFIHVAGQADGWLWQLVMLNDTGEVACGPGSIVLVGAGENTETFGTDLFVDATPSNCELYIDAAAPNVGDVLEGRFSGTLVSLAPSADKVATEGTFRALRAPDE